MEKVFSKVIPVNIYAEDGEKIESGKKMSGVGILVDGEMEFTFSKALKREKSYAHNPALYTGDHTTARLQKDAGFRLTTMVSSAYDLSKDINIDALVAEFKEALMALNK